MTFPGIDGRKYRMVSIISSFSSGFCRDLPITLTHNTHAKLEDRGML